MGTSAARLGWLTALALAASLGGCEKRWPAARPLDTHALTARAAAAPRQDEVALMGGPQAAQMTIKSQNGRTQVNGFTLLGGPATWPTARPVNAVAGPALAEVNGFQLVDATATRAPDATTTVESALESSGAQVLLAGGPGTRSHAARTAHPTTTVTQLAAASPAPAGTRLTPRVQKPLAALALFDGAQLTTSSATPQTAAAPAGPSGLDGALDFLGRIALFGLCLAGAYGVWRVRWRLPARPQDIGQPG